MKINKTKTFESTTKNKPAQEIFLNIKKLNIIIKKKNIMGLKNIIKLKNKNSNNANINPVITSYKF